MGPRRSRQRLVALMRYPACMSSTPPSRQGGLARAIYGSIVALVLLGSLTMWILTRPPVEPVEGQRPDWALGQWVMDEEMARQIHEESWRTIDEENRKALEQISAIEDPAQRQASVHEQKMAMASIKPPRSGSPYTSIYFQLDAAGNARLWQGLVIGGAHLSGPWRGDEHGVTITWRTSPDSMMLPAGNRFYLARQGAQLVDADGTVYHRRPK
jgi:hypothetical protein